jgi:hypothetical protein
MLIADVSSPLVDRSFYSIEPLLAAMTNNALSMGWGIVLFLIIVGLLIALAPSRRTSEIKRTKED